MSFDLGAAGIGFGTGLNTAMSVGGAITQGDMAARMSRMQAEALRYQARMGLLNAETENAYLNASSAQEVWNIYSDARQFRGTQKTAIAGSGFYDISSGDYALMSEAARKADKLAYGVKSSAYYQAFENSRQARMEAVRLEYAAKSAEIQGKMQKRLSRVSAFAGALGSLATGATQYAVYSGLGANNANTNA